jgi:hypothetical protein
VINRRHALGLLAGASIMPSRGFANVAPQRSEIREDLAKRFADEGTVGTFVGYKTDDYLIIASDKDRSGEAMLPASTFKIPNSVIGTALSEALRAGIATTPCARRSPHPPCRSIRRSPGASARSGCRNMSICLNMATATSVAASTSSG